MKLIVIFTKSFIRIKYYYTQNNLFIIINYLQHLWCCLSSFPFIVIPLLCPSLFLFSFKISPVKNIKASSTFCPVFAEVSKNFILYSSASFFPCSSVITRSGLSHLFPTKTLHIVLFAFCSI